MSENAVVLFFDVEVNQSDSAYAVLAGAGCLQQASSKDEDVLIQTLNDVAVTVKGGFDEVKEELCEVRGGITGGFGEVKGGLGEVKGEIREGFGVLRGGVDAVKEGLEQVKDGMREGFDEVKGSLDEVTASTQESLLRLRNLQARDYLYPRLVTVKEVENRGASSRSQGRKGRTGKRRLTSVYTRLRWVGRKQMTLHFLCPTDMSEVPCGEHGEGYRFHETRDWVKKLVPVLQVRQTSNDTFADSRHVFFLTYYRGLDASIIWSVLPEWPTT